jgi:hypothetical protein
MLLCIYNITYHTTSLLSTSCTAITIHISLARPSIPLNDVMSVGWSHVTFCFCLSGDNGTNRLSY